jgi:hypothetical protein
MNRPNLRLLNPYSATRTGSDRDFAVRQINELISRAATTKSHPHSVAFAGSGGHLSLGRGEQH